MTARIPIAPGVGDPAPALRAAVAQWLARLRGVVVDPGEVVIISGVAQVFALLAPILHAAGIGSVAVEDPGPLDARLHLQHWVKAHPLSWYAQRPTSPGLVLGYAANSPGDIAAAVEAIGSARRMFG